MSTATPRTIHEDPTMIATNYGWQRELPLRMIAIGTAEIGTYRVDTYAYGYGRCGEITCEHMVAARPDGRCCYVVYHWRDGRMEGPDYSPEGGAWVANGRTSGSINYVASWCSRVTALRRLREALGEGE